MKRHRKTDDTASPPPPPKRVCHPEAPPVALGIRELVQGEIASHLDVASRFSLSMVSRTLREWLYGIDADNVPWPAVVRAAIDEGHAGLLLHWNDMRMVKPIRLAEEYIDSGEMTRLVPLWVGAIRGMHHVQFRTIISLVYGFYYLAHDHLWEAPVALAILELPSRRDLQATMKALKDLYGGRRKSGFYPRLLSRLLQQALVAMAGEAPHAVRRDTFKWLATQVRRLKALHVGYDMGRFLLHADEPTRLLFLQELPLFCAGGPTSRDMGSRILGLVPMDTPVGRLARERVVEVFGDAAHTLVTPDHPLQTPDLELRQWPTAFPPFRWFKDDSAEAALAAWHATEHRSDMASSLSIARVAMPGAACRVLLASGMPLSQLCGSLVRYRCIDRGTWRCVWQTFTTDPVRLATLSFHLEPHTLRNYLATLPMERVSADVDFSRVFVPPPELDAVYTKTHGHPNEENLRRLFISATLTGREYGKLVGQRILDEL